MLSYDLAGDAAWITIDRPEKRNALRISGWRELVGLLERAETETRVAVLTGVGDAFCAGDDVATLEAAGTEEDVRELAICLSDAFFGIETLDVPVLAAVNGHAYGGGCELVAAADLAVSVEGARFALPETTIGAYPPYATERVAETVGRKRLMELALTGEPIDAERAREWGLVNRVVPEGDLGSAVEGFVASIAESPRTATRTAKRVAAASASSPGERDRVCDSLGAVLEDDECRAATRAFLED